MLRLLQRKKRNIFLSRLREILRLFYGESHFQKLRVLWSNRVRRRAYVRTPSVTVPRCLSRPPPQPLAPFLKRRVGTVALKQNLTVLSWSESPVMASSLAGRLDANRRRTWEQPAITSNGIAAPGFSLDSPQGVGSKLPSFALRRACYYCRWQRACCDPRRKTDQWMLAGSDCHGPEHSGPFVYRCWAWGNAHATIPCRCEQSVLHNRCGYHTQHKFPQNEPLPLACCQVSACQQTSWPCAFAQKATS